MPGTSERSDVPGLFFFWGSIIVCYAPITLRCSRIYNHGYCRIIALLWINMHQILHNMQYYFIINADRRSHHFWVRIRVAPLFLMPLKSRASGFFFIAEYPVLPHRGDFAYLCKPYFSTFSADFSVPHFATFGVRMSCILVVSWRTFESCLCAYLFIRVNTSAWPDIPCTVL